MSKLKSGNQLDYMQAATKSFARQDYANMYIYASVVLAMGGVQAAWLLCKYYDHQLEEITKQGAPLKSLTAKVGFQTFTNFGTMYKLCEYFKVKNYTAFTDDYINIFSGIDNEVKKLVISMVAGYKQYLVEATQKYPFGTEMTLEAAESLASAMRQLSLQYAKGHQVTTQELAGLVDYTPHDSASKTKPKIEGHSGHPDAKTPLLGGEDHHDHQHDKDSCCVIL